jgi:hypothetical protein
MGARARSARGARLWGGRASLLCGLLLGAGASASTPESWSVYDQEVIRACVAASSLQKARPAGERVDFDDRVGYSALLLSGRYPQPHMNHQPGRELCLFDKRTRTAVVTDADSLILRKPPSVPAPQ